MPASISGVVINEILVDPNSAGANFDTDGDGAAESTDEFVELFNTSGSPVDISGFQLWDPSGGNWFTFPALTVLQPGASAIVVVDTAGGSLPTVAAGNFAFSAGNGSSYINNGGDSVILYDPGSDTYIQATFNGSSALDAATTVAGFSATASSAGSDDFGTDTDGQSLQRFPSGSDTIVSATPTPGAANACFAHGTLIAGPDGPVRVESLGIGDQVLTDSGQCVSVKWIGRQTVSTRFGPAERLMPVRFAAGSLGDGLPFADLTVTADHGMLVDGVICHAGALVNGETITQVPLAEKGATYTVYHIETDAHEIILANGAPAETFIDNVSRRVFDNFAEFQALYGDVPEMEELPYPRAMSARQVPARVRAALAARVAA